MYICSEVKKPIHLKEKKGLILDRSMRENDLSQLSPTVCLSLSGTLFYKVSTIEAEQLNNKWMQNAVLVECDTGRFVVIPRPGASELLVELNKHACPMIYSTQTEDFIESTLLQLSISQNNSDLFDEDECEKSEAFFDHYIWSQDQCIPTTEGFKKSLGTLSEFSENGINNIWLIDHRPELVDFPSHVISVSEFTGDPQDRELFKVLDQIFIN